MDQMKSTMSGWLAAPKTKSEVQKNQAIAQAARKEQRVHKKGSSSNNRKSMTQAYQAAKENVKNNNGLIQGKKKKKTAPKKKKKQWEEDDDDDDSEMSYAEEESEEEASFVEEDEESEEEDEVSFAEESDDGDDDDEELLSPSPTPKKRRVPIVSMALDDSSDDDSDDSDVGLLSSSYAKKAARPSKPSAALKRASQASKNRYNPSLDSTKLKLKVPPPAAIKKKKAPVSKSKRRSIQDDSDSDDDSLLQTPPFQKKNSTYFKPKAKPDLDSDDSDDDDVVEVSNNNPARSSKAKRPAHFEDSSSDEDDDEIVVTKRQRHSMDSLASVVVVSGSSGSSRKSSPTTSSGEEQEKMKEEDGIWMADSPDPMPSMKLKKKMKKKKSKKAKTNNNPFANFAAGGGNDSDEMDFNAKEDEDLAMAVALSNSLKDASPTIQKKKKKIKTIDISDDDDDEPIFKEEQEEEESDGEEEDDVNDEGYDEEKEAATNVLQTAEGLSATVLQTMKTWMSSTQDENEDAHKGMIIEDGALALGGMNDDNDNDDDNDDNSNKSKEWISQEHMQQVLPQTKLSKYQLIGVNWMALLHTMECKITSLSSRSQGKSKTTNVNGILADEMGLGKTVQTIAFLAYLRHQKLFAATGGDSKAATEAHAPHLIVVPVSVLPNWVREFEKFAPEMNVVKYHGSQAERQELQNDLRRYLPKKDTSQVRNKKWAQQLQTATTDTDQLDVILAPVTYFQKEKSDDRKFLNRFKFDYLVVDEAHMLKNSQSIRYKMLDRMNTRHRLLLTGTPVQNSPQELLNMLCFIMPLFSQGGGGDPFDDDGNNASVSERMLQHFVENETMEEGDEEKAYQKLKRLFAPFVLRRKKSDVIAQLLPPKEQVVEFVTLDDGGRSIYENILAAHVNKNGSKISAAIGDHLFTNLRKAANHPLLLRTRHTSRTEISHMVEHFHKYGAFKGEGSTRERVKEELTRFNDFHIHLTALDLIDENPRRRSTLERYILPTEALFSSAKFSRLQTLLPSLISDGHRILIFSVWTSCLDLLGCLVEHLGLEYLRMDGSCPANERQVLIDRFNQDSSISIFLLSTKACGLGINLTSADTCIIHDLDFNPFNDLQAEDRCHRIGQKKKVTVYKMVTKETVDADIYTMQERKAKMNAAIMESKNDKKERRKMLNQEIQRFLGSPKAEKTDAKKNGKKIEIIDII